MNIPEGISVVTDFVSEATNGTQKQGTGSAMRTVVMKAGPEADPEFPAVIIGQDDEFGTYIVGLSRADAVKVRDGLNAALAETAEGGPIALA